MEYTSTQTIFSLYSDLYKDVWGSRPHNLKSWVGREDELEVEVDKLQSELDSILERERMQGWFMEDEVSEDEVSEDEVKDTTDPEDLVALEMEDLEMRILRGEQINF